MSLLDLAKEKCTLLNRVRTDDGYGGYKTVWTDGISFLAAFDLDTSIEAQVAEKDESVGVYTVTVPRTLELEYHDVFRRQQDGKTYRVTKPGTDRATPSISTLDMRQVNVQQWDLPVGGDG